MRKSLSLRLFSGLAAFAPLVSSQSDCWGEENTVFSKTYVLSGSSLQNCTAEIDTALRLNSYTYSGSELGALIRSVTNESLQANGYNSSNELVGNVVQKNFNFGCMNVDNYPVFFNLSISLFAASEAALWNCVGDYQNSSLPELQSILAEELTKLVRRENQEQAKITLYAFLALSAATLLLLACVALRFSPPKRRVQSASGSDSYGTFSAVELQDLAQQGYDNCLQSSGTNDGVYELPPNAV